MTPDEDSTPYRKTFDQQLKLMGDDIVNQDIWPNRRIAGEIVFEPLGNGVRVTARDGVHRVLWGFVSSKETLSQVHCLVAVYDTFRDLIAEELQKRGLAAQSEGDPIKDAEAAISKLESTVSSLRKSIQVKKVSDATLERAKAIARIASEADQQITLFTTSLKGTKSRGETDILVPE